MAKSLGTLHPMDDAKVQDVAVRLRAAESRVRVLRGISWEPSVREEFLARGAQSLPQVEYPSFDAASVHEELAASLVGVPEDDLVGAWFIRAANSIGQAADLLAAAGTPRFYECSNRLYGSPKDVLGGWSSLELAQDVDEGCAKFSGLDLGAPPLACHLAEGVADRMRSACNDLFGEDAPEVIVVDHLSANALAGATRIRILRDACFTDTDVDQLIEHEAFIHVATALNGRRQSHIPLLASSHAGTTKTQEGLAVFAEFVTGRLDPDRFRRLADRVLGVQMAIEGADFLTVYRFYLDRGLTAEQAFENTRRVFRGGVLTGGAPFTKDIVYLDGFLQVSSLLRALVSESRLDLLPLLFCGKLALEDLPALANLANRGLCLAPHYLPPWAQDRRFLVTYLTYTSFLANKRYDGEIPACDLLRKTPRQSFDDTPAHA